ncbi:hypothetical protein NEOLEDRAFT_1181126 [Neolentinus lepideus HHB14362 ss-1]|uniref:Uncharacterized protein n=1 Tax=Neolentinus lepideus HHB14362 ss-1 TaxID=1314782 RepID=A0A165QCY8_9AGAM|nr:hypothetical protein NEOLEDRAFT_1181126 [Neolentinus lepideus HHB14362 ss-1]
MTTEYDTSKATETLQQWIVRMSTDEDNKWKQLSRVTESPDRIRLGTILTPEGSQNRMRRLTFHPDEEGTYEEMILHVQGVISAMDLPPQLDAILIRPNQNFRKGFLHQSVQLTGYSNPEFQKNIDGLHLIERHIGRSFKEGVLIKWEPIDGDVHPTLSITNKFYTSTRFAERKNTIPFDKVVDPRGILTKLQDEKFIHTEDNKVTYYKVRVADDGKLQ